MVIVPPVSAIMAIEAWGSIYFFDMFLKKKDTGWLGKCRYVVLYFVGGVVAVLGGLSSGEKQKIFMV